jgi:hypothetical protein
MRHESHGTPRGFRLSKSFGKTTLAASHLAA